MSPEPSPGEILAAIVDLHGAVAHGFAQIDARFAQVDARFAQVDARFAQVDARFERLETRITSIDGELHGIRRWMARSDRRFAALEKR